MFINERKRNANTYLISNFDSLEAIYRPRQLPSLSRPKFAPASLVNSHNCLFLKIVPYGSEYFCIEET